MNANELRRVFTEFFIQKNHLYVPSASLIPHDQSLLFTNSGMVPFKPYFLGEEKPPESRAVSVQKCVRAGGKHNDLDEVGRTTRHLTFFEMMGNFSFGDYFKEEAIPTAWEFFTQCLGLDPDRLWVTVHLSDDEAEAIWRDKVGVPVERIQRLDEDNWWRMADTGPNGPCSEIFWDKGPKYGPEGGPANPEAEDRYIEIWNLVFMQFETDESGNTTPLPKPSIDTGAGLERILSVLQSRDTVFEIDEMARLVDSAEKITGYKLGVDEGSDLALRVLAEHARTMTFLISDGVFPSNEDRGYVLRRIIRRAVRFAYLLGVNGLVTPALVDSVVETMGADYPELVVTQDLVRSVVTREEAQFRKTLAKGLAILDDRLGQLKPGGELEGSVAFSLHDTYGFPYEVTAEVVAERGYTVDRAGFDRGMADQRKRAKDARKGASQMADLDQVQGLLESSGLTDFVGRAELTGTESKVLLVTGLGTDTVSVFLDRSPFYAEAGGQVGDTGEIVTETGRAQVLDTRYAVPGVHRHLAKVVDGTILAGQDATVSIDVVRRDAIRRNHTGTHMLHWALREILGEHVKQQGSLVAPNRLRFDFSHFDQLGREELAAVEDLANQEILRNPATVNEEMAKAEAEAKGAVAFFGDKYGDLVRVVQAGPSLEFCGGTHVDALGDIGLVKIINEGSIGSNMRRVEAVTGTGALDLLRVSEATVSTAAARLNVPAADVIDGIDKRMAEIDSLREQVQSLRSQAIAFQANELVKRVDKGGFVVARVDGLGRDELKELALAIRADDRVLAVVLGGAPGGGGAALVASVQPDSANHAGELIANASKLIKGGGGKGADFAMAGGKDPEGIDAALGLVAKLGGFSG